MPRFQKWLLGAQPDAPTDDVARAALTERLLAVSHFLDQAMGDADEAEAIHQLRVWTRRAAAALALFEPCLPDSQRKRLKKTLRKIRQRAGEVRDCDVYLQRLQAQEADVPRRVLRALKKHRRRSRQRLKALRRRLRTGGRFQLQVERLLESVAWPKRHSSREAPPFGAFCLRQLRPLVREFFKLAGMDLRSDEALHALRIAGKRLRYALELAPVAMPARQHQQLNASLDMIQDRLGEVVDQFAAIDHVHQWLDDVRKKRHRQKIRALLILEKGRLDRLRAKLLRWWSPARRSRLRKQWQTALS